MLNLMVTAEDVSQLLIIKIKPEITEVFIAGAQ